MRKASIVCLLAGCMAFSSAARVDPYAKLKILCDTLFSGIPDSLKIATVVVYPFVNNTRRKDKSLGMGLSAYLIANMRYYCSLTLVEPGEMHKVFDEFELSQADVIDRNTAHKVAKRLSAKLFLGGAFKENFGKDQISATLVHTERKEVISSATIDVPPELLDTLSQDLFGGRNEVRRALVRSLLLPGLGQLKTRHYGRGVISMAMCAGALGFAGFSISRAVVANVELERHKETQADPDSILTYPSAQEYDSVWNERYDDFYDTYEQRRMLAIISGAALAGAWALNVLDAVIAGVQEEKKFRPYFQLSLRGRSSAGIVCSF